MSIRFAYPVLLAALLAPAGIRAEEPSEAKAPTVEAAPAKSYDQLFGEILQNLPEKDKAKVDSAKASGNGKAPPEGESNGKGNPPDETELAEKRKKAMDKLAPDVKKRVEKAIKDMEKRRKERDAEFKDLKK